MCGFALIVTYYCAGRAVYAWFHPVCAIVVGKLQDVFHGIHNKVVGDI